MEVKDLPTNFIEGTGDPIADLEDTSDIVHESIPDVDGGLNMNYPQLMYLTQTK